MARARGAHFNDAVAVVLAVAIVTGSVRWRRCWLDRGLLANILQSAGRRPSSRRIVGGRLAKQVRFALLGLDELDDDADVDEQEGEKGDAVDED